MYPLEEVTPLAEALEQPGLLIGRQAGTRVTDAHHQTPALPTGRERDIARVGERTVKGIELQGQLEKTRAEIIAENRKDQEQLAKENEAAVEAESKAIDETLAARDRLNRLKFDALSAAEQEVIVAREMAALEKEFRQLF